MSVKKLNSEEGFTLLEIMIVLSIIGALMYVLLGGIFNQGEKGNIKTTKSQIEILKNQIKAYKMDNRKYPESWDDMINDGFMEDAPEDAWGHEIYLAVPGSHGSNKFEIWSSGPDEESDTDDDIVSWDKASDTE